MIDCGTQKQMQDHETFVKSRVCQQTQYGGPHELHIAVSNTNTSYDDGAATSVAAVAADSVRVRVHACSINALDVRMREGYGKSLFEKLREPHVFPFTLGLDCAGTIVDVGRNVVDFAVGDQVVAVKSPLSHDGHGTHADFVEIPSAMVAMMPKRLSFAEASSLPYAGVTALSAIGSFFGESSASSSRKCLVIGASGGVGSIAVQLLKASGYEVWGSCSAANMSFCRTIGVDHTIDYLTTIPQNVLAPQSVDFVLDAGPPSAIGQHPNVRQLEPLLKCIRKGGSYVTLSPPFTNDCDEHQSSWLIGAAQSVIEATVLKVCQRIVPLFIITVISLIKVIHFVVLFFYRCEFFRVSVFILIGRSSPHVEVIYRLF